MRKRIGAAIAALLMLAALTQTTASARDIGWCDDDPVFKVLGGHFRITTTIQAPASDVGGVTYIVTVPSDAVDSATAHYPQGNKIPTSVTFVSSGTPAGDATSFPVSVSIAIDPSVAATAVLTGPSVSADSITGTGSLSLSFTVAR